MYADLSISAGTLSAFGKQPKALKGIQRGVEKESLRVTMTGELSQQPHPRSLGSALTHPHITTDFSEAQLELITEVLTTPELCIAQLDDIHRFVHQGLDDELMWCTSMPCLVADDSKIPIGRYGTSNIGAVKSVYREGLANRYGRLMQTISGIHYNFSVPDAFWPVYGGTLNTTATVDQDLQTKTYFSLIRNFRRHSWLLIYLFGASPAVCRSFARSIPDHGLEMFDEGSLYLPNATSLRMGRLGYQSDAQSSLHISYNCLQAYTDSMYEALTTPYPDYEAMGVKVAGQYRQLNTSLIQIENEFYGSIRPKRPIRPGERPLNALRSRGVEYVEVRCLDLNPFLRVGLDEHQIRFLDTFLLFCLLADSPPDSPEESAQMRANQLTIVENGRAPGLTLGGLSRDRWASDILEACAPIAALLDQANSTDLYSYSLEQQRARVADADLTPSARILATMRAQNIPFFRFALNQSISHKGYFDDHPLAEKNLTHHQQLVARSLADQSQIEASDNIDFDTFLKAYLDLQ
ncbi:MAG: glutamate--cysteine ligase [Proteobacteria bacterium]|nr:glutamate--cysteine ligase [Pseudomonadota bacterium]